ncbi:unnamed protein product [Sphagnum compactum]
MMDDSINSGVVDNDTHATTSIQLESMTVYPIKSCAGFRVQVWPLSDCGLLYYTVVETESFWRYPYSEEKIYLRFGIQRLVSSLNSQLLLLLLFRAGGNSYGPEVAECNEASEISFVNEGQLFLVSKASIDELNQRMAVYVHDSLGEKNNLQIKGVCNTEHAPVSVEVDALQFRPNLVLSGSLPNNEDNWQTVSICNQQFTVLGGGNWWSSGEHRPSHRFLSQSESTTGNFGSSSR